ncbi:MAG: damage-control phosphatase ARMT1 family protein [Thermoplasmatota archaeon]
MTLDCMPCFIKQALMELRGSRLTREKEENIMRDMLFLLSEVDYEQAPVDISLIMHDRMVELGVSEDPYKELKIYSTGKALEMLPGLESEVRSSKDPLYEGALAAIAGNVMDYGAKNMLDIHEVMKRAEKAGFAIDDWNIFIERMERAERLVYLLDNSGEVVFDHLFMRLIRERFPDLSISAVVKSTPLLNDVTREDVIEAGIGSSSFIEIIEVPERGWAKPWHLEEWDDGRTLFISKGQGNFESLSGESGVFFLLVVKCEVVASYLNVDVGDIVFKYCTDR